MTEQQRSQCITAEKTANAINSIEGVPVSQIARELSLCWGSGEISGEKMKAALLESHRKLDAKVRANA